MIMATMNSNNENTSFISEKGLKVYIVFITLVFIGYMYVQFNGVILYNQTETEHEGNSRLNNSSNGHSRGHRNYYHK